MRILTHTHTHLELDEDFGRVEADVVLGRRASEVEEEDAWWSKASYDGDSRVSHY